MSAAAPPAAIECRPDAGFADWLAKLGGSLAVTTYQAGKVALLGWDGERVTFLLRQFDKPMGLAVRGHQLALATRHDVTLFADAPLLAPDYLPDRSVVYDALFLPRVAYHTGDLNTHDVALASDGLWVCATRFGCLARLGPDHSFAPAWHPKFVSELTPDDRCHLNGLAMRDDAPKSVTCLGETDEAGGWRATKASGGVVIDVPTNEVVLRGLAMPHSPRWHGGALWVLNSGAGELLRVDPAGGRADVVCALPAYLRGLAFAGPFAVVGLCQIRERHIFGGLPVQERHAELLAGVAVIDLRSGRRVGLLEFTSGCQEVYDVAVLPGVRRPMLVGRDKEASRQAVTAPGFSYWLRPAGELPAAAGAVI